MDLWEVLCSLLFKRDENFNELTFESFKFIERMIIFWTSIIIKPRPNSTADSIRKKKVRDRRFKLSYAKPINSVII
jgi:hypothetical protein